MGHVVWMQIRLGSAHDRLFQPCNYSFQALLKLHFYRNGIANIPSIWTVRHVSKCHVVSRSAVSGWPNYSELPPQPVFTVAFFAPAHSPNEKRPRSFTVRAWRLEVPIAWGGQTRGRTHRAITRGVGCVTRHCRVAITLGWHRRLHCFLAWKTAGKTGGKNWNTDKQNVGKNWERTGRWWFHIQSWPEQWFK